MSQLVPAGRTRCPLTVRHLPPDEYCAQFGLRLAHRRRDGALASSGMIYTRKMPSGSDDETRYRYCTFATGTI